MQQIVDIIDTPQIGSSNGNGSSTQHLEGMTVEEWVNMSRKILLQCYDIVWQFDNLRKGRAFDEICKIILVKTFKDEIPEGEIAHLCNKGIKTEDELKYLFEITKSQQDYPIFNEKDTINLKPQTFREVLNALDRIDAEVFKRIKGQFFETFLNMLFKDELFQMWTPPHIVDYMVNILNPQNGETICDPCSGYGNFLIKSYEYIKKTINKSNISLYGSDINYETVKIAKMNMFMHEIKNFTMQEHDGLLNTNEITENKFDVVFAHPPFLLRTYNNADYRYENYFSRNYKTNDILFVERSLNLLKPGGRMGIILIENILDGHNQGYEQFRHFIQSQAKIIKITSLPVNTFSPFTSVKTSIVFFQKFTVSEKIKHDFIYQSRINGIKGDISSNSEVNYNLFYADIKDTGINPRGHYKPDNNQLILLAKEYQQALNGASIANLTLLKQANYAQIANWSVSYLKNIVFKRNNKYHYVKLRDLMSKNMEYIRIEDTIEYKRVRVRLYDNGVELRDKVKGEEIGTKRQIRVSKGQFIVAKIGASSGGIGIVPDLLDKAIVTPDFLTYNIDARIRPDYLGLLLSTHVFRDYLEELNMGSVIKRLNEDLFLNIEIPLPSLEEQEALCQKIVNLKRILEQTVSELASEKQNFENTLFEN